MSAGQGVRHWEFNHSKTDGLHFLQMWVLPRETGGTPTYGQVDFDVEDRRNKWLRVASGHGDQTAPIALTQDATFFVSRLEGVELRHTFEPRAASDFSSSRMAASTSLHSTITIAR